MHTILYLDKEPDNLHSFHAYFRRKIEYDYFMCTKEEYALDLLISENIKILICDQEAPEHSGMEFIQGSAISTIPPILISVSRHKDLSMLEEALNQGKISCYFNKPLDYDTLYITLKKLMNDLNVEAGK